MNGFFCVCLRDSCLDWGRSSLLLADVGRSMCRGISQLMNKLSNGVTTGGQCFKVRHMTGLWDGNMLRFRRQLCDALGDLLVLWIVFASETKDGAADLG